MNLSIEGLQYVYPLLDFEINLSVFVFLKHFRNWWHLRCSWSDD